MATTKVLLIVDVENWAFDNIAKSLVSNSKAYNYKIIYSKDLKDTDYSKYAILHFFHWSLYYHWKRHGFKPTPSQVITLGIHGHHGSPEEIEYLKEVNAVSVISKKLERELLDISHRPVYYCPDGADLQLFKSKRPVNTTGKIRLGWTGNSKWGWDNKDKKGINSIIKPALVGLDSRFELSIADRNIKWRSQAEMVEWYNNIDVIVCASESEGTPLPVLEGAACERAILTTNVGIIPEFYNGRNCVIFDRNPQDLHRALKSLDHATVKTLARAARKSVLSWNRKLLCSNYEKMWRDLTRKYINITANPVTKNFGGVEISAHSLTEGLNKLGYRSEHRTKSDAILVNREDVVLVHCWDEKLLLDKLAARTDNLYVCLHHVCQNQLSWVLPDHRDHKWLLGAIGAQDATITKYEKIFVFNPYQKDILKVRYPVDVAWLQNGVAVVPKSDTTEKVPHSVLFSGRVEEHKGFSFFLKGLTPLLEDETVGECNVAGEICHKYEFPKGMNILGKIPREKVMRLYEKSEIVVMTSRYESFPYAILEAGANRCCVVTTDIPGFRALFGDAVIYVPQEDPRALQETLRWLFANSGIMQDKAEALHKLVTTKFTDTEMARHFIRKLKL